MATLLYNGNMNITNLLLDILDLCAKIYSIILRKPYTEVTVHYTPRTDRTCKVTKELIAFTVNNVSGPEIEVRKIWFLTSFNRPVFSEFLDAKLPLKVRTRDKATFIVPVEDLKAALNKSAGETIDEAVITDQNDHKHAGRAAKAVQEFFAR